MMHRHAEPQTDIHRKAVERANQLCSGIECTIIETKMDKDGGFYACNVSNRTIEYAYPSSTNAKQANKNPTKVAEKMLESTSHIKPGATLPLWMVDRWYYMRAAMLAA